MEKDIEKLAPPRWQPVIPLEYTESLSQYEILCKIMCKLNQVIDAVNLELTEDVLEFVKEHFNELMIDVIYDAELERITLKSVDSAGITVHQYDNNTLEIIAVKKGE